jgi:hypothetical protein
MAATPVSIAPHHHWILQAPSRVSWTLISRFCLAMAIIVMNAADVVTTRMLLDVGGRETNPIANHFLEQGTLVYVKIGLAGLVGVLMVIAPLRRRVESVLALACCAYGTVLSFHLLQLALSGR